MGKNIIMNKNKITAKARAKNMNQRGMVLWLTGLSGSGKSTIANEIERLLIENGKKAYILDGDNLRFGLNSNLGFTDEDRSENIRRIAETAALFADAGIITIVSAISPLIAHRSFARSVCSKKAAFAEIYIKTSIEECIKRDPKGLYAKAISGEIKDFTGVSAPYEEPIDPEITIHTQNLSAEKAAQEIDEYVNIILSLEEMTERAVQIAVKAGEIIMGIYNKDFSIVEKDDKSPLTEADLESDKYINKYLKLYYPKYSVLSEETSDDKQRLKNKNCFIVDPLDGTKEFIKKNGEFTVNIAFTHRNKTIMGVVYAPAKNLLYYAAQGLGAYHQTAEKQSYFDENMRIFVSDKKDGFVVMQSRSHQDERLVDLLNRNESRILKRMDAGSSLKGCYIAQGIADTYYRPGYTMEWDTAAMQCIVEEAGGILMQGDDSFMRYNRENSLNDKGFYILNSPHNKFE